MTGWRLKDVKVHAKGSTDCKTWSLELSDSKVYVFDHRATLVSEVSLHDAGGSQSGGFSGYPVG